MNRRMRRLLYRSFDKPLDGQEQKELEQAMRRSEVADEYHQVSLLRRHLPALSAANVKPFFAERVVCRVAMLRRPQDLFYPFLLRTFRHVLVAATVCIFILIAFNFFTGTPSSTNSMLSSNSSLEELFSSAFTPSWEELL